MNHMPIREFLRGGYQRLTGPTVISKHGVPMFTVMPPITPDRLAAGVTGGHREPSQEVSAQDPGEQVLDVPVREDDGQLPRRVGNSTSVQAGRAEGRSEAP